MKGNDKMNGREIATIIAEWVDNNNIDKRDFERMSVIELMNLLIKDKQ
jgi:hypothetical protein